MIHPAERGRGLLASFRDTMLSAADEVNLMFAYITAPDDDYVPEELWGRLVAVVGGMYARGPLTRARRH